MDKKIIAEAVRVIWEALEKKGLEESHDDFLPIADSIFEAYGIERP